MREIPAREPATGRFPSEYGRNGTPARIVCTALALALLVLALRIATVW
jgi:hypothetical protein